MFSFLSNLSSKQTRAVQQVQTDRQKFDELLRRGVAGKLTPADQAEFDRLGELLGVNPEQAEAAANTLAEVDAAEHLAADLERRRQTMIGANGAVTAFKAETDALFRQRDTDFRNLRAQAEDARRLFDEADVAARNLPTLLRDNAKLLDRPFVGKPAYIVAGDAVATAEGEWALTEREVTRRRSSGNTEDDAKFEAECERLRVQFHALRDREARQKADAARRGIECFAVTKEQLQATSIDFSLFDFQPAPEQTAAELSALVAMFREGHAAQRRTVRAVAFA